MSIKNVILPNTEFNSSEEVIINSNTNVDVKPFDTDKIDDRITEQSNKNYDKTVEKIVDVAKNHLNGQNKEKDNLRKFFTYFFAVLLGAQFLSVIVVMVLSAIEPLKFKISDSLLLAYITSVFVETLGAVTLMITFAFGSKEEVKVVELLTAIVQYYQKYDKHHGKSYK